MKNSARIDELTPPGKADIHGDFGAYFCAGYRRSLVHGWAAGPTAFMSEYILGVTPAAPGFAKVRIQPHLGSLKWVEGVYPTPRGPIFVRHEKLSNGNLRSTIRVQQVD